MGKLYYIPTADFIQKTLNAELLSGVTAAATLNNITSIPNLAGIMIIDRVDANGSETPTKTEVISFEATSGSTVTTLVRGLAGTSEQTHAVGAIVEFGPDVIWAQALLDAVGQIVNPATGLADYTAKVMKPTAPYIAVGSDATGDLYYRGAGGTLSRLALGTDTQILTANASVPYWSTFSGITTNSTAILTNKRIEPRIVSATSYTTDTGTALSVATCDEFIVTAQAGALKFNNPGGTPVEGEKLIIRIKDDGTARALTYDTQFRASSDLALPTTTVLGKTLYMGFEYNATDTKWDLLAVANNF